jgi:homoaconitase
MSPAAATPTDANAAAFDANTAQAWATYYAANPEQDPYAAQGGYQAVMAAYYQQQYAQYYPGYAYGQTQSPAPGAGGAAPPPPPPSDHASSGYGAPPPPPPPAASPGGYSAVRNPLISRLLAK